MRYHEKDGMWDYDPRIPIRETLTRTAIRMHSILEEPERPLLRVIVPDLSSYTCSIEGSCVSTQYVVVSYTLICLFSGVATGDELLA